MFLSTIMCVRNKPHPSTFTRSVFKNLFVFPWRLGMLQIVQHTHKKEALNFSALKSEASQKANIITVQQASLSLSQSCHGTTKGQMSSLCDN